MKSWKPSELSKPVVADKNLWQHRWTTQHQNTQSCNHVLVEAGIVRAQSKNQLEPLKFATYENCRCKMRRRTILPDLRGWHTLSLVEFHDGGPNLGHHMDMGHAVRSGGNGWTLVRQWLESQWVWHPSVNLGAWLISVGSLAPFPKSVIHDMSSLKSTFPCDISAADSLEKAHILSNALVQVNLDAILCRRYPIQQCNCTTQYKIHLDKHTQKHKHTYVRQVGKFEHWSWWRWRHIWSSSQQVSCQAQCKLLIEHQRPMQK